MKLSKDEKAIARKLGLTDRKIRERLRKGWEWNKAISTPLPPEECVPPILTSNEARNAVVSPMTVRRRLKAGLSRKEALYKEPRKPIIKLHERGDRVYSFKTYATIQPLLDEAIEKSGYSVSDFLGVLVGILVPHLDIDKLIDIKGKPLKEIMIDKSE